MPAGNAPLFLAPVSWLMTWRSRRLRDAVGETAARQGAVLVGLFREVVDDSSARPDRWAAVRADRWPLHRLRANLASASISISVSRDASDATPTPVKAGRTAPKWRANTGTSCAMPSASSPRT
jgi:hypothetical protein